MRVLLNQSGGKPLQMLYIFDPLRTAILLVGGDKQAITDGMSGSCRLRTESTSNT
jgi:hypothetical protein